MSIDLKFYKTVQENCTPAAWSQGVRLTRENTRFLKEKFSDSEIVLRLLIPAHSLSPRVGLFPEDGDWLCNCKDPNDPCAHVAAAVIALKQGMVESSAESSSETLSDLDMKEKKQLGFSQLIYDFKEGDRGLYLERRIVSPESGSFVLDRPLRALVGGIQSGRIAISPLPSTQEDMSVDLLVTAKINFVERAQLLRVFDLLQNSPNVLLEGKEIKISTHKVGLKIRIIDEGQGFRVQRYQGEIPIERRFKNGVVLVAGVLRPVEHPRLTPQENSLVESDGQYMSMSEAEVFSRDVLPELRKKLHVEVLTSRLPEVKEFEPYVEIETREVLGAFGSLEVLARVAYGDPAEMYWVDGALRPATSFVNRALYKRNEVAESRLFLRLKQELQMMVNRPVRFSGDEALQWARQLRAPNAFWKLKGQALSKFEIRGEIAPLIKVDNDRKFDFEFVVKKLPGVAHDSQDFHSQQEARCSLTDVFRAWSAGESVVALSGGGFAPLPKDWLTRYGPRLKALLALRDQDKKIPEIKIAELTHFTQEIQGELPDVLAQFKRRLLDLSEVPQYGLPQDLKAELRDYQVFGYRWLQMLREMKVGGVLADDMGLGKTLQTLATFQGRCLIVCPTSLIFNWAREIERFRPSLRVLSYHGARRFADGIGKCADKKKADFDSYDVVITSYGLLRLDQDRLAAEKWDQIVLDEAQMIKNPESQVAAAAFALKGNFKLALTGTPIENRLEDIWSLFHFVNPGLLGSVREFRDEYVKPIQAGESERSNNKAQEKLQWLKAKTKPFILRRLKKDVAKELPPKTETVLYAEFENRERELYDALFASTRKEVLAQLSSGVSSDVSEDSAAVGGGGGGRSFIAALEALLRLRQACCHGALVPGQSDFVTSAKLELLLEKLESSIESGHKNIVFSQWTSFLDLIQAALVARGVLVLRIDGSTKNRGEIVEKFQNSESAEKVLIMSLKAGGVGLNLTAADHVFIMDPWWNPAAEEQAADRAYRIGQNNAVLVHKLVVRDTVEEKILVLQSQKKELAKAVLTDGAPMVGLTRQDILSLVGE